MYLVSLYEKESLVEASLGGRITADEIAVFGEELLELIQDFERRPFTLFLDHSRAKRLDGHAIQALGNVKDHCLAAGAVEIICAAADNDDRIIHTTARLQHVLEGSERFVADGKQARIDRAAVALEQQAA